MPVLISMLRGVNVGGHNQIKMEALRTLYEQLGMQDPRTYVQSGNVVLRTKERDLRRLTKLLEDGIERSFGFRPDVILRTASELRTAIEPILRSDGWVVDSDYRRKLGTLVLERADTVVWLDLPLRVCLRRLWGRTLPRIKNREDGASIDKILLTKDSRFVPAGLETSALSSQCQ